MKRLAVLALIAIPLALVGCASSTQSAGSGSPSTSAAAAPAPTIPDLTGNWAEVADASASPSSTTQTAVIMGNTIEITWHNTDGTTALYWAGSFTAPTTPGNTYEWDSANDTTKTESAILASSDPTKHFTYKDGKLSYPVSALGVTKTETLQKQ
jgi:hypothetical protein